MNIRSRFFFRVAVACAAAISVCLIAVACVPGGALGIASPARLSVMTYNAHAFFDSVENGAEFAEFRGPKSRWSAERYSARLDRLREAILIAGKQAGMGGSRGPDIAVIEEIESASVLTDLCNRMPRIAGYAHAAFASPEKGSAFGCAIISRFPVVSVTVHSVGGTGELLRPILEVELDIAGVPFVVFASHWKSKSGDGKESADGGDGLSKSARARRAQEAVLLARIRALEESRPGSYWVACGDFNQGSAEFASMDAYVNCWDLWLERCAAGIVPGPEGSYWYGGEWERIDHFFLPAEASLPPFEFLDFRVVAEPPLLDENSHPAGYEVYSGKGYSDHLPLVLVLKKA